jgi:tetratricopeptide (TPR) repeat protein
MMEHLPLSYQGYTEQFFTSPEKAIARLGAAIQKRNSGAPGYMVLSVLCAWSGYRSQAVHHAWTAGILAPGSKRFRQLPFLIERFLEAAKSAGIGTQNNVPKNREELSSKDESTTNNGSPIRDTTIKNTTTGNTTIGNTTTGDGPMWTGQEEIRRAVDLWNTMESGVRFPSALPSSASGDPDSSEYAVGDLDQFIETLSDPNLVRISVPAKFHPAEDQESDAADRASVSLKNISINPTPTATLANILANQGHTEKAIELYRELLLRQPGRKQEYEAAILALEQVRNAQEDS